MEVLYITSCVHLITRLLYADKLIFTHLIYCYNFVRCSILSFRYTGNIKITIDYNFKNFHAAINYLKQEEHLTKLARHVFV